MKMQLRLKSEGPGRGWWGPPKGTHTAANVSGGEEKAQEPRKIGTKEEADQFFANTFGETWGEGLSEEEKEAVDKYCGGAYRARNAYLRGKWPPAPKAGESVEDILELYEDDIAKVKQANSAMDKAFSAGGKQISEPMVVYRGGGRQIADLPVGAEFTDKGYLSTSVLSYEASDFVKARSVFSRIVVPKGKTALWGTDYEKELIFPRGTSFRVKAKEERNKFGSKPFTYVELEML